MKYKKRYFKRMRFKKRYLSVNGFGDSYNVGRTSTYKMIAEGQIRAVKIGSRTIIDVDSAERWAASLPRFKSAATPAS
jgi:excisionase family DNA binding protein